MRNELDLDGVSRMPRVAALVGMSRSQIYRLIQMGRFPKQLKLSERISGWRNADIMEFLKGKKEWV
jgi:prophage regulatory protein